MDAFDSPLELRRSWPASNSPASYMTALKVAQGYEFMSFRYSFCQLNSGCLRKCSAALK